MIEAKDHYDAALGIALTREHMAVAPASTGKNNATTVAATVAFSPLVAVSAATTPDLPDPAARRLPESRRLGLPPLPLTPDRYERSAGPQPGLRSWRLSRLR